MSDRRGRLQASPPDDRAGEVLIVAVSARMLAELAVADGYAVTAVDRFGDVDLRALGPVATAGSSDGLTALAEAAQAEAVVYGAGFENRPDLVARLACGRELLGTPADLLAAVRDPWELAAAARAAGLRAPETPGPTARPRTPESRRPAAGLSAPDTRGAAVVGDGWLRKPRAGGGGRGVRRWRGGALHRTEILQRLVPGRSCSAVAVGDGRGATLLGLTEQLHGPGFRWAGNITPPQLPATELQELHAQLQTACDALAARFGVRGAFGVDVIWDGRDAWALELNPRPTASLELFGRGVFAAHAAGARGRPLPTPVTTDPSGCEKVKLVLYADGDLRAPDPSWWPSAVRDIPPHGQPIRRGAPVCTLIAETGDVAAVRRRGAELLAALPRPALATGG